MIFKMMSYKIDKEKDRESKLGAHTSTSLSAGGVRKYDYEIGRFTSVDPLWEKYTGWTGYQYSGNNPITRYDNNGKWVKEISKENHRNSKTIERNSNGYLANKINYEFYDNYKIKAPNVAKFISENNLFVMQSRLGLNEYGLGEIGGNLSKYDLSKEGAFTDLEGSVLHEIVHNMGFGEFSAWSAMLAAGYDVESQIRSFIKSGNPEYQGYIFDNIDQISKETWGKFISGDINIDGIISIMQNHGKSIIK